MLATLTLLMAVPAAVSPEKLSVLLPNQNTQFDLEHEPEFDPSSSGLNRGLSAPLELPVPPVSQLPLAAPPVSQLSLAAPPAPLPIGPPGPPDSRSSLAGDDNTLQDRVPPVSGEWPTCLRCAQLASGVLNGTR